MHLRPFFYWFASCLIAVTAGGQTISSFTPTFGQPGDSVTITGSGFLNATEVDFNGHVAVAYVMDQFGTQISATVPSGTSVGYNYITIKGTGGTSNTSVNPFTVIGAGPYIDSFPQTAGVGSSITLTGAHFSGFAGGAGTVKFNGTTASYYAPTTDSQLTVIVPNGVSGQITATTSAGSWTSTNLFYYPPKVTSFSPPSGRPGTNVVIKGTNFYGVTTISFGGVNALVYTTNSNFQITATIPDLATSGVVRVFTPGGQFATSSNFYVVPNIVSFSPYAGTVGTDVTLNGTNLNGSALKVFFNGVQAAITSTNFYQLQVKVPNSATSGPITVQSSDGTNSTTTNFFLPPSISSFSPTNGAPGATITIIGQNFTNATSVQFDGIEATSFTVVANTNIHATVPAGSTSGQITVVTPGGVAHSLDGFFGAPAISSVSPPAGVVGVSVTIAGTNFFGTTAVKFNGVSANFTTYTNDTVQTTVPLGATTGPITLSTRGGTASWNSFFIEPLILSVSNLDASTVRVSWTTNAPGFVLQTTTSLLSTNNVWTDDTNATQIIGSAVTVTNNTTGVPRKFYRLQN